MKKDQKYGERGRQRGVPLVNLSWMKEARGKRGDVYLNAGTPVGSHSSKRAQILGTRTELIRSLTGKITQKGRRQGSALLGRMPVPKFQAPSERDQLTSTDSVCSARVPEVRRLRRPPGELVVVAGEGVVLLGMGSDCSGVPSSKKAAVVTCCYIIGATVQR